MANKDTTPEYNQVSVQKYETRNGNKGRIYNNQQSGFQTFVRNDTFPNNKDVNHISEVLRYKG